MKSLIIILATVLIFSTSVLAKEDNHLNLNVINPRVSINENIECSLELLTKNRNTQFYLENSSQIQDHSLKSSLSNLDYSIIYQTSFQVKPDKIGKTTLGPFSINFNGKKYTSNKVTVEIVANRPGQSVGILPIYYSGKVGDIVDIKLKFVNLSLMDKVVVDKKLFEKIGTVKLGMRSRNITFKNGKRQNVEEIKIFLTPKSKGSYKITKAYFKNLPANLSVEEAEIVIE